MVNRLWSTIEVFLSQVSGKSSLLQGGEGNHCRSMIFILLHLLHVLDILKASKIEAVEYFPEWK